MYEGGAYDQGRAVAGPEDVQPGERVFVHIKSHGYFTQVGVGQLVPGHPSEMGAMAGHDGRGMFQDPRSARN